MVLLLTNKPFSVILVTYQLFLRSAKMSKMKFDPKTGEWVAVEGSSEAQSLNAINTRQQKISTPSQKRKLTSQEIREKNLNHEFYGYAIRLCEMIVKDLGLKNFNRVIFRNRESYCCYNSNTKNIELGYQMIMSIVERGHFEPYKNVQHVWYRNGYTNRMFGKQAIWEVILHELAHHLQDESGHLYPIGQAKYHHSYFQNHLNDLIEMYPYEDVKNI